MERQFLSDQHSLAEEFVREKLTWHFIAQIIFHAGPTNSGKTHHALLRMRDAKSGVYCGPLRMLAVEVHQKMNEQVKSLSVCLSV